MDIKSWLEQAGEPVAETCFPRKEAPPLPYICFLDSEDRSGGDMRNLMSSHNLTVERYSNTSEYNLQLEALLDEKALKYTREQTWISDQEMYVTIYTIRTPIIERNDI